MKAEYSIENEKLCLNGKPAALIFGDLDQIKAIREYEEMNKNIKTIGLDIYPTYEIQFRFKCICGNQIFHEEEIDSSDNVDDFQPTKKCMCYRCERRYAFEHEGTDSVYVVRFIGYKKTDD